MQFTVRGQTISLGWLVALAVAIASFVLILVGKDKSWELYLILALSVAFLIG